MIYYMLIFKKTKIFHPFLIPLPLTHGSNQGLKVTVRFDIRYEKHIFWTLASAPAPRGRIKILKVLCTTHDQYLYHIHVPKFQDCVPKTVGWDRAEEGRMDIHILTDIPLFGACTRFYDKTFTVGVLIVSYLVLSP